MPTYEYICKECNKTFVVISTIFDHLIGGQLNGSVLVDQVVRPEN